MEKTLLLVVVLQAGGQNNACLVQDNLQLLKQFDQKVYG